MENFKQQKIPIIGTDTFEELRGKIEKLKTTVLQSDTHLKLKNLYEIKKRGIDDIIEAKKSTFEKFGKFNAFASKKRLTKTELGGLYIFYTMEKDTIDFQYVGISRKIISRLRNHGWGSHSNSSTLAFLKAKEDGISRKSYNVKDSDIRQPYLKQVLNYYVFILPYMECTYKLQLLEVIAACNLQTYWNTFKTH